MKTLSAIDIGYRGVKALATNDRQAHFPSVVGSEERVTFSLDEAKVSSLVLTMKEGVTWCVGHTALLQSEQKAGGGRRGDWIFSEPYRVLLCAALSELHKSTVATSVVTGLPLEHYNTYAVKARSVFVGEHTFRRKGGRWQTVTVEDVLVVTQPYGSLLDLALADNGVALDNPFAVGVVGICDIGGVTLNLLVTDSLREVGQWTKGDGLGLLAALEEIATDLRADYPGFSPKAYEVAEWVDKGTFSYQGQEVDIAPYAEHRLSPLVRLILGRMADVWSEPGRYDAVLLTGGGAVALSKMLKAQMDSVYANVTVAQDAIFANCRGYLKLARRLWGGE